MTHDRSHPAPTTIAGPMGDAGRAEVPDGPVDPRAVRVSVSASARLDGDPAITVSPPPDPDTRLSQDGDAGSPLPLVLDDVLSELDPQRSAALLRHLPPGQVVLTTAGVLPEAAHPDAIVRISAGTVVA